MMSEWNLREAAFRVSEFAPFSDAVERQKRRFSIIKLMIDDDWLNELAWDAQGLIPAIAQEAATGDVLMLA